MGEERGFIIEIKMRYKQFRASIQQIFCVLSEYFEVHAKLHRVKLSK